MLQTPQRKTTTRFDFKAYQVALSYYGLPINYNRVFKTHPMTDKNTGNPILGKDGKQLMTLLSCKAAQESMAGNAVWVQINPPFEGSAIFNGTTYPKKATNQEIAIIRNVTLDFEYPPDPHKAHHVAIKLVDYLASMGLVEPMHPIEDSGAGTHIVMPIIPVETTPNDPLWNASVAHVVKQLIEPEFNRLCTEANIVMDLEGFDISRIISCPGTWRPTNPKKADCEWLKEGYLRRWLAPYTDGNYPTRIENAKLSDLIMAAYTELKTQVSQNVTRGKKQLEHNAAASLNDLSDSELIQRAMAAQNGSALIELWHGDTSGYGDDWSSADLAFCNKFAFWTGCDAARMDRIFRQSALYRAKWDRAARTGETYGEGTIREAIASCNEVYDPLYYKRSNSKQDQRQSNSLTHNTPNESNKSALSYDGIKAKLLEIIEKQDLSDEGIDSFMNLAREAGRLDDSGQAKIEGAIKDKVSKHKMLSWQRFKKVMDESAKAHQAETLNLEDIPKYRKTAAGMLLNTEDGGVLISNFAAEIIADIKADDGAEITRLYELEAELAGRFFRFEVPAEKFEECRWKDREIGARAIITTGNSMKSHLTNAIKYCSDPDEKLLYSHAGWRNFGNGMGFLHNEGALSQVSQVETRDFIYLTHRWLSSGPAWQAVLETHKKRISQVSQVSQEKIQASVRFTGSLQHYLFPSERGNLKSAIRASLKVLDLTHDVVTVPLYCGVWRSVLGEVDFGEHLSGQTGWGKSELCALIQQHFGPSMTSHRLPGSWESTENSLEMLLFQAKDVVVVVDDFKPKGSKADQERLHAKADRVFRQIGNGSARGRLTADLQQRVERRPRCLLISTGEDVPQGQSCKARCVVLSMSERITVGEAARKLSDAQRDARQGLYAQVTAGYVEWLAPSIEAIQARLPELIAEEREHLRIEGHARASTNTANLLAGMKFFLLYACELGAITVEEAQAYLTRCRSALIQLAEEASQADRQDKQSEQWRKLIVTALTSKKAHLSDPDGKYPGLEYGWKMRLRSIEHEDSLDEEEAFDGGGSQIGWIDGDDIYLDPEAAYQAARSIGGNLTTLETTLRKFLHQDGLLASTNLDKPNRKTYTVRRRLQGIQRNVLHVKKSILFSEDPYVDSVDSVDILDSQPSEAASEAASDVSQVNDSEASESSNSVDSDLTQESDLSQNQETLSSPRAEYQSLYKQLQQIPPKKLAPLGNIHWYVPESGFEKGLVDTTEYAKRLLALLKSNDPRKIQAGRDEMLRKLSLSNERQG
jgi:hypothetical protein